MASAFGAGLSEHPRPAEAAGELAGALLDQVGPEPDLVVVFASGSHAEHLEHAAETLRFALRPRHLLGATASGVLGGAREVEARPALSAWAGRVPVTGAMHLTVVRTTEGAHLTGWPKGTTAGSALVMIADPFSFPADGVVAAMAGQQPGLAVLGGLASASSGPRGNTLIVDDDVHHEGAVCVMLGPEAEVTAVVSQGCRPVGRPMVVTDADRNVVRSIAGQPALQRLREMVDGLAPDDRELAARGLHLGLVVDEHRSDFGRGDFLVRNLLGADADAGTLAIGDVVEVGSTVQFHIRDAVSADEDLRAMLADRHADGALVFTCTGRGRHLFGEDDHDARVASELLGRPALAGMFCAGELGPVGPQSHLHGFTASLLLFNGG